MTRPAPVRPAPRAAFTDHPGVLALAHRGHAPGGAENTLAAFSAAVDLGYRYLETDVRATADGRLVAFHDPDLDRATDARGAVADLPWSVVSRARVAGLEPVALLEDVLGSFPGARFNVDVKTDAAVAGLGEVLRRTGCDGRLLLTAFSGRRRRDALAAAARAGLRDVATSASSTATAAALAASRAPLPAAPRTRAVRTALAGVDAVQVPVRERVGPLDLTVVDERFVDDVHAAGAQVHVWTVDDPVQAGALLDLGVDGIVTDRADVLRELLLARGQW